MDPSQASDEQRHRILLIEDEEAIALAYQAYFQDVGYDIVTAGTARAAMKLLEAEQFSVVISDLLLPDLHGLELFRKYKKTAGDRVAPSWMMITGHATVNSAVEVIKEGIDHYFVKPVDLQELEIFVAKGIRNYSIRLQNWNYKNREQNRDVEDRLIGRSRAYTEMKDLSRTAAASEASILIRGESGTGKELVAQLIHALSPRCAKPFIKVNCAAIPEPLLEAELFGHEQGAFTDARKLRKGKFEIADGGTIFLDEIGDMTPKLQVKLLRVLQEREVERLGGNRTIPLDIRLVAATNSDLESKIRSGEFREDLYYRINVIAIPVPALRERGRDDILLLASHFLAKFNAKNKKMFGQVSVETQELLSRYRWPGNVRELENVIERAVVLGTGESLQPEHLPPTIREQAPVDMDVVNRILELSMPLETLERELIRRAIRRSQGNISKAARKLGLTRRTLQYRMEKHDVTRESCLEELPAKA